MFKKIDSQTLMAVGVLLVSFIALFISVRQTAIMGEQTRLLVEQNKASAWPYLEIDLNRGFTRDQYGKLDITDYKIVITNKGTGPAIVEAVRISYDGESSRNWHDLYKITGIPDSISSAHSNSSVMNKVIATNEEVRMLTLSNNSELMNWVFERGDKIVMEICYRSVYDDHWVVRRDGFKSNFEMTTSEKTDACQVAAEDIFIE
ncbi:MAG: hypothetical protein HEP71_15700 [Roseivirga sp.]|nr:hypothetical protein [Roseivirga sp.]